MLERALPQMDAGKCERAQAREFVRQMWKRIQTLVRATVDFFASGGPLS